MLAQVFGSTVNSQTTNNFFTSTFLQALQSVLISSSAYSVIVVETELTINAAPVVPIFAAVAGKQFSCSFRNTSPAGGPIIRISSAPSFAPNAGMLLNPGDVWLIDQISVSLSAVANGAGALLTANVYRTP